MTLATAILRDLHANTEALSRPTRCFALMGAVRKALTTAGLQSGEVHFDISGCRSYHTDPVSGQRYVVSVEPCADGEYRE